MRVPSNYI